ncbi:Dehydrogenase/reductase SDR member 2, mitochondrial [Branchiostoma belcheri]|nr:Dehydrogenase/reductase SDR member 2, mitochondrial [Branchiostoma belcheri]
MGKGELKLQSQLRAKSVVLAQCVKMASRAASGGKLAGKVAVVTASTDGIGLAIARRLGQDGAKVVISSRKEKNVQRALQELQGENLDVTGMVCHVGKAEDRTNLIQHMKGPHKYYLLGALPGPQMKGACKYYLYSKDLILAVDKYGGLDILVSNAAANPAFGPMLDTTETAWDKIFDTNVKAAFFLAKEAVPHMEKRGAGSVVFVSSIGGYVPFELLGPYSVSKTALLGLVKAMAPQCGRLNIRVNGIAPGIIQTRFSEAIWKNEGPLKEQLLQIPLSRLGQPEDCSGPVSFLCSDDAAYITGETIVMSGGMVSRL